MKTCPHCGAKLVETARFCPHCMTTLTEKRVIPTPKHLPIRWLSVTAALFVLCGAVCVVRFAWPWNTKPANLISVTSTSASAATTARGTFYAPSTTTTALVTTTTAVATSTSHTTTPTSSTASATMQPTSSSVTASTTTTTKKPTTTTTAAPVKKYPAEWDTVYRSTTEDNLPIEEVNWTYKDAGTQIHVSRLTYTTPPWSNSHTFSQTYRFRIPFTECIVITGFDAPAENGIYRIPAAIDGKVVVAVDMRYSVEGTCQFNDPEIAPTVKRIYLPPELMILQKSTIDLCTNLEVIHISSDTLWLEPEALPQTKHSLHLYSQLHCYMSCETDAETPLLKDYCDYIDYQDGYTNRYGAGYYTNTTWRPISFALYDLYGGDV